MADADGGSKRVYVCVCVREESVGARREREEELENRVYITVFYFSTPLSHPTLLRDLPLSHVFHIYIYVSWRGLKPLVMIITSGIVTSESGEPRKRGTAAGNGHR